MGCGDVVEDIGDTFSDAWDDVLDFVDDVADFTKDLVDDVVDFTESLTKDIIEATADITRLANNIIEIPVLSDFVDKTIDITEDTLIKAVDITYEGVRIGNDTAYYTVKGVTTTLKEGNALEIVLTVAAAIATGGTSLIYQFAIPGITNSLYMHGVISQEWAMAINVGAQIYGVFYGATNPGSNITNLTNTFTWMGASASTALYLANAINTAMAIAGPVMQVYGMYEAYNTVKSLEDMYATKLAEYEAWRNSFQQNQVKQEIEWKEGMAYADGTYYEKLPGQFMYGVFSASREAYVPMDTPQPAHWVEDTKPPFIADKEVANIMWDVKDVEFRNKFDLVPYDLDTGSTVGNATQGKGLYLASKEAYDKSLAEYEKALAAQNAAIAAKETKVLETTTAINEKLVEIDNMIKEAETDIANLTSALDSLYISKNGLKYSTSVYNVTTNTFTDVYASGGQFDAYINTPRLNMMNDKKKLITQVSKLKANKLTLESQLEKLKSI